MKPFDQRVDLARDVPEVNGRSDNQGIGGKDAFDQWGQIVLPVALAALGAFSLTQQAAAAAGIGEIKQVNVFRLRADRFCAFLRFFQHHGRVPVLPGTAVEDDGFHIAFLLCLM